MTSVVDLTLTPSTKDIGGFSVGRVLPSARRRSVGPFVFWDEMGPGQFAPGKGMDVRPHPHIGLATLTYLFSGEIMHRDSLGVVQAITPGALNVMLAGRGIVHSERTRPELREAGHLLHGIQAWIALPAEEEESEPQFHHHPAADLPELTFPSGSARVILGTFGGARSPVRSPSPIMYVHADFEAGGRLDISDEHEERAIYVVDGSVSVDGAVYGPQTMAIFKTGGTVAIDAGETARVMVFGGQPLGPRHIWWNYVSSSQGRIEKAKADWVQSAEKGFQDAYFSLPPDETEHIPLPETASGPVESSEDCPTS